MALFPSLSFEVLQLVNSMTAKGQSTHAELRKAIYDYLVERLQPAKEYKVTCVEIKDKDSGYSVAIDVTVIEVPTDIKISFNVSP